MTMTQTVPDLLTAQAVRVRTRLIFDAGRADKLAHFALHLDKLPACAKFVADIIRQNYPNLNVPPHSRWRHLSANGQDWSERLGAHLSKDKHERARQRIELAIISVLLDAGAGAPWQWRDPVTGRDYVRSEGLALASLEAYRLGLFSSDKAQPCVIDSFGLAAVGADALAHVFQASKANPLVGVEGRVALLHALGKAIISAQDLFGAVPRLGNLYDALTTMRGNKSIAAADVLAVVLRAFGPIWPSRLTIGGVPLGDTWRHPAVKVNGPTNGLVPFHKLSQWLTYSLIEPLQDAGIAVTDLDGLTGLAEYRNGGLFIDVGVIVPRDAALAEKPLKPEAEAIVEWRALTVALLDELAPLVRNELGKSAAELPLASILEGGTWAAGRKIAKAKRADGSPPLNIMSDGTVF